MSAKLCDCGCNWPGRSGFSRQSSGQWVGLGAGYTLVRLRNAWTVLTPDGGLVTGPKDRIPTSMDEANLLATKHARERGHGHP